MQHPEVEVLEVNTDEEFVKIRMQNTIFIFQEVNGRIRYTSRYQYKQVQGDDYVSRHIYGQGFRQAAAIIRDRF